MKIFSTQSIYSTVSQRDFHFQPSSFGPPIFLHDRSVFPQAVNFRLDLNQILNKKSYYNCNQAGYFPSPNDVASYPSLNDVKTETSNADQKAKPTNSCPPTQMKPMTQNDDVRSKIKLEPVPTRTGGQSPDSGCHLDSGGSSGSSDGGFTKSDYYSNSDSSNRESPQLKPSAETRNSMIPSSPDSRPIQNSSPYNNGKVLCVFQFFGLVRNFYELSFLKLGTKRKL